MTSNAHATPAATGPPIAMGPAVDRVLPSSMQAVPSAEGMILRADLLSQLGVRHGFSTRLGGCSSGRYATLNLGDRWGDDTAAVAENLRRLAHAGSFSIETLCTVAQVHGTHAHLATHPTRRAHEADAIVTAGPLTAGIYTADCVPILLTDGRGRVAAVHAGWRGTVADICASTVAVLAQQGAVPADLTAAIGPSIGPCCFEVKEDVARPFQSAFGERVIERRAGKSYVNLQFANRLALQRAGIPTSRIEEVAPCTCCQTKQFFSFRRDGAGIGQQLSFIVGGPS